MDSEMSKETFDQMIKNILYSILFEEGKINKETISNVRDNKQTKEVA